ncbi:endonuclease Q family protein [Patescibacteria group bacterium]|nr:endonuclease Q family protein [Patescibacteria group bacterium]
MQYIADFHIHSKYSRATSPQMDLEHLDYEAARKGIQVLGTGDFTHPAWFKELKEKLHLVSEGIYQVKNSKYLTNFILTSELSCIYKKNGKCRRIHLVFLAPSLEVVEKINKKLDQRFNIRSDGRPILGVDAEELAKLIFDISPKCFLICAHIWTPWFSLFGAKSGFDTVEECFGEMSSKVYAMETGLSSDPAMNWRLSALDKYTLLSNSDAHSPRNLGREANVFDLKKLTYSNLINAIKTKKGLEYTIEFYPEEGKYHLDGHRACDIKMTPQESIKNKNICPQCHRPLTIGVLHRVNELADRPEGFIPSKAIPFKSIIPLPELISEIKGVGPKSKTVQKEYDSLISKGQSEFNILLHLSFSQLKEITSLELARAIIKAREGKVIKEAGYDGVYGKIKVSESEDGKISQKKLF